MEKKEIRQENKMGVMPVNKLLLSMSLPMMASMMVQALYNIVDSIFVARVSESALTAVSMAFPMQSLMISVAGGTGVGINAILSRSLGEKDQKKANNTAMNGIFVSIICYLVFLVIGLTAVTPFYHSQTSDTTILNAGIDYLSVVMAMSFGMFAQFVFERLLISTGRTFLSMITQSTGAIINIILDPIFIFGYFGIPAMGAKGAAIATVIGQIIAGTLALFLNLHKNPDLQLKFKGFKPNGALIGEMYKIGIPSIIMQSIGSVMTYSMNLILVGFSATAVAVFGVYFKLQSFIFLPVFGLNNGMVPIIAFNYGAQKRKRMISACKLSILYAEIIMLFGTCVFELIPGVLFKLFAASPEMLAIGIPALRVIGVHFPVAAFCIVVGSLFQALGYSVYTMINSIMRQLIVLIPAAYLLSLLGNVNYVWWSLPIAEIMSATVTVFFLIRLNKNVISRIPE